MTKTALLIDGNSLAFRAYYAMINQVDRFISHNGLHTNALVAFNNFFDQIVDTIQPDYALVAWDAGKASTTFRGESFDEYKAQRKTTPEELVEQFPYLRKLVELHGVKSYSQDGIEADDIVGTMAKIAEDDGLQVLIYTGDKDYLQLITDNVTVNVTKKGVSELDIFTPSLFAERYDGLSPQQMIQIKGLTGDTSDNYPGVTKVGEKTAIKLLKEFGSIDGIYDHVDEMKASKLKENLLTDKEIAYRALDLATIRVDSDLNIGLDDIKYTGIDYPELVKFYEEIDFKQQLAKIRALNLDGSKNSTDSQTVVAQSTSFIPLNESNFSHVAEIDAPFVLYIELDSDNYYTASAIGFVLGNSKTGFFVSRDINYLNNPDIQKLLTSDLPKSTFNLKSHYVFLKKRGINLVNVTFDFLLTSYLLDTNDNDNTLATLAGRYDQYLVSDESFYGKGAKFSVPGDNELFGHLANKASVIEKLKQSQLDDLASHEQLNLYQNIELPLSIVLGDMEFAGIKIDVPLLTQMGLDFDAQIKELESEIYRDAGQEFNISSPKQLGELLFEKMGIPPVKKTKTGYSTDAEVLSQLAPSYPFVEKILQYRQLTKLNSTYVKGLLDAVDPNDSKLHTRYLQTLTQTGRLSSVEPNLQNIPDRDDLGKSIRKAFIPSFEPAEILGADYSQIELRVLASISKDPELIAAFKDGEDIHDATARRIFQLLPTETVSFDQRRHAKAVNFGIVYGISDFGLAKSIGSSRVAAKEMIENYFHNFSGVKTWIDNTIQQAKKDGYVSTLFNRRRYLPEINSKIFNLRSFAERTATNSPIQGSAADLIKIAMIKVAEVIKQRELETRMLLQIHDELLFEVPDSEVELFSNLLKETMENVTQLNVPLSVDVHYGRTWYDEK
ncbi:MAG: DNA polymerase I [Lactobacillaceae bacterium]|nr:DNA polymerase I [Lactobacillaceae bacterium]